MKAPITMAPTLLFRDLTLEQLDAAHTWVNRDGAPREECFMALSPTDYTYGKGRGERTYSSIPFSELVGDIRRQVSELVNFEYDLCFSNKYKDESDHLGWHADNSDSIDHTAPITVVSFGSERELWVRPIPPPSPISRGQVHEATEKHPLPHGSVLIMGAGMQQTHHHRIPKHSGKCGVRISLTFRKLKK